MWPWNSPALLLLAATVTSVVGTEFSRMAHLPPCAKLLAVIQSQKRKQAEMSFLQRTLDIAADCEVGQHEGASSNLHLVATLTLQQHPLKFDSRTTEEVEEDTRRTTMYRQELKKLKPLLPGVGRGYSALNDAASRLRVELRYPAAQGGIYAAADSSQVRYKTGVSKEEFDDFYEDTFKDAEGNLLRRPWFFQQPRNNLGNYSAEENAQRRTIRGSMSDRDRVICFLEMLRRDTLFEDMAEKYGRSSGTWSNQFWDMTMVARNMPCLQQEIQWPDATERAHHADFLERYGHPDFPRIAYIADGTMVGKGKEEPHDAVHALNYSGNKGLGTNHIVYTNARGKLLRVVTVNGCKTDRAAHLSSRVYLEPDQFLSEGEVGMGDGNYRGVARSDDNFLQMCTPRREQAGGLPAAERRFNSEQRRFRVVVENTIRQIKKWKVIGGKVPFRHERKFELEVFDLCARLPARIMRVRDQYPRSKDWIGDKKEDWESKLGVHYYWDYEHPGCYFLHVEGENYVYENVTEGTATDLQNRWDAIWGMTDE